MTPKQLRALCDAHEATITELERAHGCSQANGRKYRATIDRLTATRDQMAKESKNTEAQLGLAIQNRNAAQGLADIASKQRQATDKAMEIIASKIVHASPLGVLREGKTVEDHLDAIILRGRLVAEEGLNDETILIHLTEHIAEAASSLLPAHPQCVTPESAGDLLAAITRDAHRAHRDLASMTMDRDGCAEERDKARAKIEYITGIDSGMPYVDLVDSLALAVGERKRAVAERDRFAAADVEQRQTILELREELDQAPGDARFRRALDLKGQELQEALTARDSAVAEHQALKKERDRIDMLAGMLGCSRDLVVIIVEDMISKGLSTIQEEGDPNDEDEEGEVEWERMALLIGQLAADVVALGGEITVKRPGEDDE